ncbi:MAG: hypothetical protein M3347_02225 [Armatimonadota bacterium]|nr:hypothetical protein [Armatimonadota bacterium]
MSKTLVAGVLGLTVALCGVTQAASTTSPEAKRPVLVVAGAKSLSKADKAALSGQGTKVKSNGGGTRVQIPGTLKVKLRLK